MKVWHERTITLVGTKPVVTADAAAIVAATEQRLGLALPTAVRAWYLLDDACEILAAYSNEDLAFGLAEMAIVKWQGMTLLPFRAENQGVCVWAVFIDGSDDPPVWIDCDNDGRTWQLCCERFSDFIFTCVWDFARVMQQPTTMLGYPQEVSPAVLARLRESFEELPQTRGWPGQVNYRFERDGTHMIVCDSDFGPNVWIAADNDDRLGALQDACRSAGLCESFEPSF